MELLSEATPGDTSPFNDRFALAAAICQAGIAAFPEPLPNPLKGPSLLRFGVGLVNAECANVDGADSAGGGPLVGVAERSFDDCCGRGVFKSLRLAWPPLADGVVASLFPSSNFRLFNSELNSRSLLSLSCFAPSSAFGISSLRLLTSSVILLFSSSRRRDAAFKSLAKVSTSERALSSR